MKKNTNIPIFFVLGRERSGTTMLRVNLNNHSCIHIPPESPFIIYLHNKYANKKKINLSSFINDLKQEPFLFIWNIDYDRLEKRLQLTSPPTFQNYCKEILNHKQQNKTILGDKNPIYSLFGKTLQQNFPEAKFIWIIRDYRAQVNSMLKVNFEKKIISSLVARWVAYNTAIESLKNEFPNKVLLIKYENLVAKPEENYRIICDFLKIEYESSLLQTDKHNREFYPAHHTSLNEIINTKHVNEWKTELSMEQIKICEAVAGNYGEHFGYKKTQFPSAPITLKIYLGIIYGRLYIPFITTMYRFPLKLRRTINKQIIYKNATFWKDAKKYYKS